MKKSLVLAMAMALGVTASAYAANPFSDVPAGHWAYDSIDKLAAAGVIDGMGDGTYQGDKTMTRYEMAQIVAKAMAKGANVDKLAAEFADELDNMGVRVANLEKKADNVKITGTIRADYWSYHGEKRKTSNNRSRLRSDLNLTGAINEDWTYAAVIRNEQFFDKSGKGSGEETTRFMEANVNGRIGGVKVKAGRYSEDLEESSIIYSDRVDGIRVSYGKKVKLTAAYEQIAEWDYPTKKTKMAYASADTKIGVVGVHIADYVVGDGGVAAYNNSRVEDKLSIFAAKASVPVTKAVSASLTYLKADDKDLNGDNSAWIGALSYSKGKVGAWAKYFDMAETCTLGGNNGLNGYNPFFGGKLPADGGKGGQGAKGWVIGGSYAIAKNISATVEWHDWKGKATGDKSDTIFTRLQFKF